MTAPPKLHRRRRPILILGRVFDAVIAYCMRRVKLKTGQAGCWLFLKEKKKVCNRTWHQRKCVFVVPYLCRPVIS